VEKATGELEKAAAGQRRGGEGGRRAARRRDGEGSKRAAALRHGGDAGRRALGRRGEHRGGTTERVHSRCGDFFFMENGNNRATVRELRTRGYDYLLGWCCSP
jgi:hypothetical protein